MAGLITGVGMFALAKGAIQASSEMENAQAQLATLFKSAEKAEQVLGFIVRFAAQAPFEFTAIRQAAVFLEVYGLTAYKWLPLVADLAAGSSGDIVQAAQAVSKATVGETEMLKELGITARHLIAAGAMEKAGALQSRTAEQALQMQKAIETVIGQRFGGALQRFGTTWKALTSMVTDFFDRFLRAVGGAGLMTEAKATVGGILEFIEAFEAKGRGDTPSRLDRLAGALSRILSIPFKMFGIELENIAVEGGPVDKVIAKLEGAADWLDENWPTLWGTAKAIVKRAWDDVVGYVEGGIAGVETAIGTTLADVLAGLRQDIGRELDRLAIEIQLFGAKIAEPAGLVMTLAGGIMLLAGQPKGLVMVAAGLTTGRVGERLRLQAEVGAQELYGRETGQLLPPIGELPEYAFGRKGIRMSRQYREQLAARRRAVARGMPVSAYEEMEEQRRAKRPMTAEEIRILMESARREREYREWEEAERARLFGKEAAHAYAKELAKQEAAGGP